jgi:hypothetical protein
MNAVALALVMLLADPKDEAKNPVVDFVAKCEAARPQTIKAMEEGLRALKASPTKNAKEKGARVKEAEALLKAVKAGEALAIPYTVPGRKLKPGDFGRITVQASQPNARQVVDGRNVIFEMGFLDGVTPYWLSGMDTAGIKADERFTISVPVIAAGTRELETSEGGTKSVVVLQAIDVAEAEKVWKESKENKK